MAFSENQYFKQIKALFYFKQTCKFHVIVLEKYSKIPISLGCMLFPYL